MADPLQPTTIDEVLGLRTLAALLDGAVEVLAAARRGYRLAFLCRLAVVVPLVALRLAWRLAPRRSSLAVRAAQRSVHEP